MTDSITHCLKFSKGEAQVHCAFFFPRIVMDSQGNVLETSPCVILDLLEPKRLPIFGSFDTQVIT